jgi:hypothetical protein
MTKRTSWTSGSSESSLYCLGLFSHHRTTNWQSFLCLIFQPYTRCLFQFLRKGSQQLTGEISILEGTLASEFRLTLHLLLLIKQTVNLLAPQWHQTAPMLLHLSNFSITSTLLSKDINLLLYPYHPYQLIHLPFHTWIKHMGHNYFHRL